MVRRTVAFGAGLVVLILLVIGVRGCLDSQRQSAITDYVTDVDALMRESNQLGEQLFAQLEGGQQGGTDVDAQNALNSFRIQSVQLVDRATGFDVPGDMETAQRYAVDTLELRAQGVAQIADNLPNALTQGDQQSGAAEEIAAAMRLFLASDEIYDKRVLPAIDEVLDSEGLEQRVVRSAYLPDDLGWLDASEVASRIGGLGDGGGDEDAASGVHGNGLGTVTLGGVTLVAGGSVSVPVSGDLAFDVQVVNQGDSTETDVTVTATIGSGGDAIEADAVIDTIAAGEAQTVSIPLDQEPPTGQSVPVTVEIELVDGEDPDVGNNTGEYTVIFTS